MKRDKGHLRGWEPRPGGVAGPLNASQPKAWDVSAYSPGLRELPFAEHMRLLYSAEGPTHGPPALMRSPLTLERLKMLVK